VTAFLCWAAKNSLRGTHDIHKTQSLLQIIILNLNKIKNIGSDKILALTKISTKYWRQQNTGVNRIWALTQSWRRQKLGVDKKLAQTKRWRRRMRISLLLGSADSAAANFSQALLKISHFSLMVLLSVHAVVK
jgi:hypothetical protein